MISNEPENIHTHPAAPIKRLPPARRRLFILLSICLCAGFCLLISELALRIFQGAPDLPLPGGSLRNDPHTGTAMVSNYTGLFRTAGRTTRFTTNRQGLRDVERDYQKDIQTCRILMLGDSYAQGHGVEYEEMFPTILERTLPALEGFDKIEIIKAAVGGWGPVNELAYLASEGRHYQPDMVIVTFFVGNDYWDAENPDQFVAYRGIRISRDQMEAMDLSREIRIALRKHCFLYGTIVNLYKGLRMSRREKAEESLGIINLCLPAALPPPTEAVRHSFQGFKDWCTSNTTPLLTVILPHRTQIEIASTRALCKEFNINFTELDLMKPNMPLLSILEDLGIAYIDLTRPLQEWGANQESISLGVDSHYNAATHAFVGQYLAKEIGARRADAIPPAD